MRLTTGTKRLVLVAGSLFLIGGIVSAWLFSNGNVNPPIAPSAQAIPAASSQEADEIVEAPPGSLPIVEAQPGSVPEAYFLKHYEADPKNKDRQTWNEYWHYVRQFYRGRLLTRGWHKVSEDLLATIDDRVHRQRLKTKLDVLGRCIAREWAKHNDTRKINTNDLIRWSRRLGTTDAPPGADAATVEAIVDAIRAEVDKRLGTTSAADV